MKREIRKLYFNKPFRIKCLIGCIGRVNKNNASIIFSIQERNDNEEEELEKDNGCPETIVEQM